ncbi:4-hydroxy-tetrahydrodipicolinate reductase [Naasia sp. SYSU D00948]|uniref:4-hydroxy-tetrahydrodipicolinate reductase n=1 Tax=Naasia sp. SYSU D00948 TaxID=2817379 RepID=UPI0027DD3238|nr:4-hydroxy-tetrahydrodipicolinate reductase [Naasia sp. SYSU D00948]
MQSAPTTRVAIAGATGRMGSLADRLIEAAEGFEVVARLDSRTPLDAMTDADLVVDFTLPHVSPKVVDFAVAHGMRALVGTSGWTGERIEALRRRVAAAPGTGVLIVPNFSVGSVLATSFAAMAARFFDSIEILEAHHARKVDSPSGTAVRTAELIGAARADLGPVSAPHADQRARGQQVASVPVHSLRLSGVVAKQDVLFGGDGEVLTISHETLSPSAYESGILLALRAARDLEGVTVGLDSLLDLRLAPPRDGTAARPPADGEPSGQAAAATTA